MSYQEKRTLTSILSGFAILVSYSIFAISRVNSDNASYDLKSWASAMLIFIGVGIIATIIVQILFHIFLSIWVAIREQEYDDKEIERRIKAEVIEDERDHLIELKSSQISFMLTGFGFIGSLIMVVLGYSAITMINLVFFSFLIGSIIEGFVQIFYYRKN